jgi:large subunit ribosomal protein L17
MRHRKVGRQLRRTPEQKLALMRSLAQSLIEHGAIETTEAKAKELRPFVEKLITKAKEGTLHARRLAGRHVQQRRINDKLFQDVGPKFATRKGGYTRILKTGHRKGDGAEMARIELVVE